MCFRVVLGFSRLSLLVFSVLFATQAFGWEISLTYDGNQPNPGDEVTIKVNTDTPLFCMGLGISVVGDANFTDAMKTANCNQYGWDPTWNCDPYLDANDPNWVYIGGVEWPGDANGTVGYVKMRYYSGEVAVFITEDDSFDANCQSIPYCAKKLIFGPTKPITLVYDGNTPDPNQEVTVYIHTTEPLFDLEGLVQVTGNAQITSAMGIADSNQYDWDTCWSDDPYLDPNGFLAEVSAAKWNADANGTIGYVKFNYYDGEVTVSLTGQAFDSDCNAVAFSEKNLVFGRHYEGEQQMQFSMMSGGIADANTNGTDANSTTQNGSGTNSSNNGSDSSSGSNTSGGTSNNSTSGSGTNTGTSSNNGGSGSSNNSNNTGTGSGSDPNYLNSQADPNSPNYIPPLPPYDPNIAKRKKEAHKIVCPAVSSASQGLSRASFNTRARTQSAPAQQYRDTPTTVISGYERWTADCNLNDQVIVVDGLLDITPDANRIFITRSGSSGIYVRNGTVRFLGQPGKEVVFISQDGVSGPFIYIDPNSTELSQIEFCVFQDTSDEPNTAIRIENKRLQRPIANCQFYNNWNGVSQNGPELTDLTNNLFTGISNFAIDSNFASVNNGQPNQWTMFTAKSNTIDYCYQAFNITTCADPCTQGPDNVGTLNLYNNAVTECGIGIGLYGNAVYAFVENTGYWYNYYDWDPLMLDFSVQVNPVWDYSEYGPYESDYNYGIEWDWYISKTSPFAAVTNGDPNAGTRRLPFDPEISGSTIFVDHTPRPYREGIGAGVSIMDYSNAGASNLSGDFNNDLTVNFVDLANFASYWLMNYNDNSQIACWDFDGSGQIDFRDLSAYIQYWPYPFDFHSFSSFAMVWKKQFDNKSNDKRFDLNNDGIVDARDYALIAKNWGQTGNGQPAIVPIIMGDPNSSYVEIGVSGFRSDTEHSMLFDDGRFISEIQDFANGNTILLDVAATNPEHHLKLVSLSNSGQVVCANVSDMVFSCPITHALIPDTYEPGKPLFFTAMNPSATDVNVAVYADGGNVVSTQTLSGNVISGTISADITSQHELDYIVLSTSTQPYKPPMRRPTYPTTKEEQIDANTQALMILPDFKVSLDDFDTIGKVHAAFRDTGVKVAILGCMHAQSWHIACYAILCPHLRYIYFDGHGGYAKDVNSTILRTNVWLSDGKAFSVKDTDYPLGSAPFWCVPLEMDVEDDPVLTWAAMGFTSLEFVFFDCCHAGKLKIDSYDRLVKGQQGQTGVFDGPQSDMSVALGMATGVPRSCVYQSWFDDASASSISTFSKFAQDEWNQLALGRGFTNLYTAMGFAIGRARVDPILGTNPMNMYRLKGQGSPSEISLHP
jgi:hypothetical protein